MVGGNKNLNYPYFYKYLDSGDTYYGVKGEKAQDAIESLFSALVVPEGLDRKALKVEILDREAIMPTAIGGGFALPHPRKPLENSELKPFIALAYCDTPVDWVALDDIKVSNFFLVVSTNKEEHLALLGELTGLLRDKDFVKFLEEKPTKKELLDYLVRENPVATR